MPQSPILEAFARGLRDLGYVEGQNILIERRFAAGKLERLLALAAELVRLNVGVIVALDPPATAAAKDATKTIPIVMRSSDDPTATGLVASFARPGGNITGVYSPYAELSPKRLELLKETLPGIMRVAVLWDPAFWGSTRAWRETEAAARSLGLELKSLEAQRADDLEGAFRTATRARSGALITLRNPLIVRHQLQVVKLAAKSELPAMYDDRPFVEAGGLMSYGANLADLYRRAAGYVDKILKGAKPADLPVEQPTRFELVINGKTARALGLTIPQSILIRADQVIQ
jgi:putative ABC transport system substrate-binding protein